MELDIAGAFIFFDNQNAGLRNFARFLEGRYPTRPFALYPVSQPDRLVLTLWGAKRPEHQESSDSAYLQVSVSNISELLSFVSVIYQYLHQYGWRLAADQLSFRVYEMISRGKRAILPIEHGLIVYNENKYSIITADPDDEDLRVESNEFLW